MTYVMLRVLTSCGLILGINTHSKDPFWTLTVDRLAPQQSQQNQLHCVTLSRRLKVGGSST